MDTQYSLDEFWGAWSDETAERTRVAIRKSRNRSDEKRVDAKE